MAARSAGILLSGLVGIPLRQQEELVECADAALEGLVDILQNVPEELTAPIWRAKRWGR